MKRLPSYILALLALLLLANWLLLAFPLLSGRASFFLTMECYERLLNSGQFETIEDITWPKGTSLLRSFGAIAIYFLIPPISIIWTRATSIMLLLSSLYIEILFWQSATAQNWLSNYLSAEAIDPVWELFFILFHPAVWSFPLSTLLCYMVLKKVTAKYEKPDIQPAKSE